jgi:hypothetical protein
MPLNIKPYEPKRETIGGIDKWEVEDALKTITRAQEIKTNSNLFAAVKLLAMHQKRWLELVLLGKKS